jgi:hypothetical protein
MASIVGGPSGASVRTRADRSRTRPHLGHNLDTGANPLHVVRFARGINSGYGAWLRRHLEWAEAMPWVRSSCTPIDQPLRAPTNTCNKHGCLSHARWPSGIGVLGEVPVQRRAAGPEVLGDVRAGMAIGLHPLGGGRCARCRRPGGADRTWSVRPGPCRIAHPGCGAVPLRRAWACRRDGKTPRLAATSHPGSRSGAAANAAMPSGGSATRS